MDEDQTMSDWQRLDHVLDNNKKVFSFSVHLGKNKMHLSQSLKISNGDRKSLMCPYLQDKVFKILRMTF